MIDLRYALRLMGRDPGFTAAAIFSLALGTGISTSIFSLFDTIVLRPLPVSHPEQLVEFVPGKTDSPRSSAYWEWADYEIFRDGSHAFSAFTGMSFDNVASVQVTGAPPTTVICEAVLGNYFRMLGVEPAIGRLTGPEDVPANGSGSVAVISWNYWTRVLHSDPSVPGRKISVNGEYKTIAGVSQRGYTGPRVGSETAIWIPQEHAPFTILARLKPGVTRAEAQGEIAVLYRHAVAERARRDRSVHPQSGPIQVESARSGLIHIRELYGKSLFLLLGVVTLLMLLTCSNLASMLLARTASRSRELATRISLGAGRGHLLRQLLTEALVLSFAGMLAGIAAAYAATAMLVRILASGRDFEHIDLQVRVDWRLLLFAFAVALLNGLLFGSAPAWQSLRVPPIAALRASGAGGQSVLGSVFGKFLVMIQIALAIFLVSTAAVFLKHVARLRNFDLGFHRDHVLLISVDPTHSGKTSSQLATSYRTALADLARVPGARSASMSGCTPLQGCGIPGRYIVVENRVDPPAVRRRAGVTFVTPRYFATLGIPLLAGRDFSEADATQSRVVIINKAFVERYFPTINPLGRHIRIDRNAPPGWFGSDQPYEVIGISGSVKSVELRDAVRPTMYFDMFQDSQLMDQFSVRTSGRPESIANSVRDVLGRDLPGTSITRQITLEAQVDANIVPERLLALLSKFFGILGSALAGAGLYGLLAWSVARRTKEVGIRMALGATAGGIGALMLREVLALVVIGAGAGCALVLFGQPLFHHVVQDLESDVTRVLMEGTTAVIIIAAAAACLPAVRAARLDPAVALRHD